MGPVDVPIDVSETLIRAVPSRNLCAPAISFRLPTSLDMALSW